MRVLVTGSGGFIGSTIALALVKRSYKVTGLDKEDVALGDYIRTIEADARDFFRRDAEHFDLVIHCAAVVGGRILVESLMAHAENLEIDAALFQWAERTKPGRIVYVSSVAVYPVGLQGAGSKIHLYEGDVDPLHPPLPDELYGWAKLTGEFLAFRSSVPVSIPRPFTVYGEGQDPVFPFANIMRQVRERRDPLTVWGSGAQVRDFIHVQDVADGIIAMAEQEIDGPVNFCTGIPASLNDIARMMADSAGYYPDIEHLRDKPEGLSYRVGDPARLHGFYKPRITLEEGIERGLR